jgi:hypothetical protein
VQNAKRLCIALDGHRGDRILGGELMPLDSHCESQEALISAEDGRQIYNGRTNKTRHVALFLS